MKPMKRRFFPFWLTILLLIPWHMATAQEVITISTLEIDLWPEYDRPEMLVIYRIELSPEVSLPAEISIQIPTVAGEPNAVAIQDPNGSLMNAPYERVVNDDWAVITLTASMPDIQIEYYDPQLGGNGSEKSYEHTWRGDYSIGSLFVQLQQPIDASQVETHPAVTSATQGSDGLTYHTIDFGSQPAGSNSTIRVTYLKDTDALSIERFEVQPSAPISERTPGRVTIMEVLPWGLGVLGILLLVGGVWWYWQTGREKPKKRKSSRVQRSRGRRAARQVKRMPKVDQGSTGTADDGIYCHQCGKRAETGDRFCRSCGTKFKAR
jgi:hypothetical protein